MEILFLGTSAAEGWPALFCTCENCQRAAQAGGKNVRTRPSTLIDGTILVDPGPDMHHHALAYGLRFADLEGIVVTHAHADHLAADEFHFTCSPFSHRDMTRRLSIWGNETVLELIRRAVRTDDAQEIGERFGLTLDLARPEEPLQIGAYTITPLRADHDPQQQCLFYCFEREGKAFLQANDTGYFPDATWAWLEGRPLDAVSLDCTNGRLEGRVGHMGVQAVIDVVERLRKHGQLRPDGRAVATHFSHNGALLHDELETWLNPHGIEVAYDGMQLAV